MNVQGRTGAIILARMDSSRLPGKGLIKVYGKPILAYVFERLNLISGLDEVILATSDRPIDDPLESFARQRDIQIYRGAIHNVARRVRETVNTFKLDTFIRVNGDSPLIDYANIRQGMEIFKDGNYDLVTNVLQRSFPVGMSVEVIRTSSFEKAYLQMKHQDDFEHVTKYFYDNSNLFKIYNITSGDDSLRELHFAIDTTDDLHLFKTIIEHINGDHLEYSREALVELYRRFA